MRKLLIMLLLGVGFSIIISSCKKTETNPLLDVKNLSLGSYIAFAEKTSVTFNITDLASAEVSIKVNQVGSDIDKIGMYIVIGANTDTTTWAFIKTVPYTDSATVLSASATEVAAALGITLNDFTAGESFTIYDRIYTKNGRQFDITNINPDVESNSNYNMAFRWTTYVSCPFTGNMAGTYKVIEDDWADWSEGDLVTVEDGPGDNQINLEHVYPNPAYGNLLNPIIVDIDPATGIATVPEVQYGDYGGGFIASCTGGGFVFSCAGTIDLTLDQFTASSDYGNYRLVLQKQ